MRIKLPKLQNHNNKTKKLSAKRLPKNYKDVKEVFHY